MQMFGAGIPFAAWCGIRAVGVVDGRTRLAVQPRPEHTNNLGIAHDGLTCILLNIAIGTAARVTTGCTAVMTLGMYTSFLARGEGTSLRRAGCSAPAAL
jgi:acyl-coenzyme A thioesterase PaaI-like protein